MNAAEVLVVDDEDDVRASAADILRSEGYEVLEANDGIAAMELLRERPFSVVVLDVRMPRRGGIEVLEALDEPPPVVLMSAYCLDAAVRSRLGDKVGAFLKKPFPPRRLLEEVGAAARSAAAHSQEQRQEEP